jgi:hypothetical protein
MHQGWSAKSRELRRRVEERSVSLHEAMQEICDQACSVAHADGAAIGKLKAGQLIYEAGSGAAAFFAERRVTATLVTSGADQGTGEILRVEDAETDSRIQSEICRQFGAKSLLMMAFWCEGTLAGILQISFDQPHRFLDPELEAYRVLTALAEEAMVLSLHPERNNRRTDSGLSPSVTHPGNSSVPVSNEASVLRSQTEALPIFRHVLDVAIAAMILVATVGLVLSREHARVSLPAPTASPAVNPITQPETAVSSPAAPSSPNSAVEDAILPGTKPSPRRRTSSAGQVRHFGDDVTVRYFAPKDAVARSRDEIEVHRIKDDVTVRYFRPSTADQH